MTELPRYLVSDDDINSEYMPDAERPTKFQHQTSFPYCSLPSGRDFERLLYCIYRHPSTIKQVNGFYDEAILMQGSKERGRDVLLKSNGEPVGLVQCKKYGENLGRSELGKEILKFVLFAILDPKLIGTSNENFRYHIAVSHDISETGKNLISEINADTFDEPELKEWTESAVAKSKSFEGMTFDSVKNELLATMNKIRVVPVYPVDLDVFLNNPEYTDVVRLFFKVQLVSDVGAVDEALASRERTAIEYEATLTPLECQLRELDRQLFSEFEGIRQAALELYNAHGTHCLTFSNHCKRHHLELPKIVSKTVLGSVLIDTLNKHEVFVLAAACYLTDVGVCDDRDALRQIYEAGFRKIGPHEDVETVIQESHHLLSAERIRSMAIIPEPYREPIALVAQVDETLLHNLSAAAEFSDEYAIDPYDREKVCLPLLAYALLIADAINVRDFTSRYLLRRHRHTDTYADAKAIWDETPSKVVIEPSGDGERLQCKGSIHNQLIYLGIVEHLKYVQQLLSKAHETLRKQPAARRLTLRFVDNHTHSPYESNFGFSVDEENVLASFINNTIYENGYGGLRELVQNAMDSCVLRGKRDDGSYEPLITVVLTADSVCVRDNGMGMDRHDVNNYFAKLGRSYYVENHIPNSIGRFGVGVFTYFGLGDSFVVETTTIEAAPLKFTASRNAPYGFYFHSEPDLPPGTQVTIPLKPEFRDKSNDLADYIYETFKHTKIPIEVRNDFSTTVVSHTGFDVTKERMIENCVEAPFRDSFSEYDFFTAELYTDDFGGVCGFFVPPQVDGEHFDLRRKASGCKVFQNGVFVTRFSNLFGEINLKTPLRLKMDRDGFKDNIELQKVISQFERALLQKIRPTLVAGQEFNFTRFYLYNFYGNGEIDPDSLRNAAELHWILVVVGDQLLSLTHRQLAEFQQVGLLHADMGELKLDRAHAKSKELGIPFVSVSSMIDTNYLRRYLRATGFGFRIRNFADDSALIATQGEETETPSYTVKQCVVLPFADECLCSHLTNLGDSEYINSQHPIVRCMEENYDQLSANHELARHAEKFFDTVVDYLRNAYPPLSMGHRMIRLSDLNVYLTPINSTLDTDFCISRADFPQWMLDRIVD